MKVNVGGRAAMAKNDFGWKERRKTSQKRRMKEERANRRRVGATLIPFIKTHHPIIQPPAISHPSISHHPSMEGTTRPLTPPNPPHTR